VARAGFKAGVQIRASKRGDKMPEQNIINQWKDERYSMSFEMPGSVKDNIIGWKVSAKGDDMDQLVTDVANLKKQAEQIAKER
jgi:hypothetical protein